MRDKTNDRFTYYPVGAECIKLNIELCQSFMLNVFRQLPYQSLEKIKKKQRTFCDSGGLQIHEAAKAGKSVVVSPMMRTRNTKHTLIIGIIDNCHIYRRADSKSAMMIDWPVYEHDTDLEYQNKLFQSRKARDQMLRVAPQLCPNTKLAIALQPRVPSEIRHYFARIYDPYVSIYAYPIRNFRNKPKDALGNAFVLSFLSSVGVKRVHFLGSNAACIIFLLAKASALDMFQKVSFDSSTWNQSSKEYLRYLAPSTLSPTPRDGKLHAHDNLRTILKAQDGVIEEVIGCFDPPKWIIAKDWVGLFNIRAIEMFKDRALKIALDNDLEKYIKCFGKYSNNQKDKILEALELLEESKAYGHDHIDKKYGRRIRELYS